MSQLVSRSLFGSLAALTTVTVASCFPVGGTAFSPPMMASPEAIQQQQREATARSLGYPTRKSPAELEAMIAQQTKSFTIAPWHVDGTLDAPPTFTIDGVRGTCYTVVIHLGTGAVWGLGAEGGLRFDFQAPTGPGSGGPGVVGPGAVASVGCAEATGPITLTMSPMIGRDPIGSGPFSAALYRHRLSAQEAKHLEVDKQRQIDESNAFAERERAKKEQHETRGCATCNARYQGCLGAGGNRSSCGDMYRSCAFEEVGADYPSACPTP